MGSREVVGMPPATPAAAAATPAAAAAAAATEQVVSGAAPAVATGAPTTAAAVAAGGSRGACNTCTCTTTYGSSRASTTQRTVQQYFHHERAHNHRTCSSPRENQTHSHRTLFLTALPTAPVLHRIVSSVAKHARDLRPPVPQLQVGGNLQPPQPGRVPSSVSRQQALAAAAAAAGAAAATTAAATAAVARQAPCVGVRPEGSMPRAAASLPPPPMPPCSQQPPAPPPGTSAPATHQLLVLLLGPSGFFLAGHVEAVDPPPAALRQGHMAVRREPRSHQVAPRGQPCGLPCQPCRPCLAACLAAAVLLPRPLTVIYWSAGHAQPTPCLLPQPCHRRPP